MFAFEEKRIVITGAGGGVGSAMVKLFGQLGATVIACDLPGGAKKLPGDTERYEFDLGDKTATIAAATKIIEGGTPDVVISNAGWARAETLEQLTSDDFDHELDVNLRGAVHFTSTFLVPMRANPNGGNFLFISSVNAEQHFGNPAYSAAKAGLNAWMRAIASEEGCNNIRANALLPGSIRTSAWDHRIEKDPTIIERVSALYPLGRMVNPAEVAQAAAFLASPLASGITGVSLPVDAGLSASNLHFIREIS